MPALDSIRLPVAGVSSAPEPDEAVSPGLDESISYAERYAEQQRLAQIAAAEEAQEEDEEDLDQNYVHAEYPVVQQQSAVGKVREQVSAAVNSAEQKFLDNGGRAEITESVIVAGFPWWLIILPFLDIYLLIGLFNRDPEWHVFTKWGQAAIILANIVLTLLLIIVFYVVFKVGCGAVPGIVLKGASYFSKTAEICKAITTN